MDSIYKINFEKSAVKFIKKQDMKSQKRIMNAIMKLPLGDVKKLKGHDAIYRLRVGDYRILFEKYEDKLVIIIIDIGNRGQIYK